ncbi:putative adenylosuccinate synthetase [Selenomonas ruminantium subsp. lactilytica TAM6421]|uniref:Adenylosuccinate synthetase n=1 Tax=Selenomonas ruminantium subsp. lactilytica (strain NBRC 103574 / TAM6421) TaxID=927704 RepID=I0GMD5_SELRL|nr:adenylosuccinate synthase [Selenomonas ruminantium]BAL81922.1 putative adenylosuccinate synthetase [Selenomonas ruminantium subsp. lactilytica TAM6421]
MSTVVVTGTQWGDEGKGKIVDYLAQQADTVVRFQGGSNAGHTVMVDGEAYKLRLMPSGILFKGSHCIVGNGVAFDPMVMLEEMDGLAERGIDLSGIRISNRAHVVLPYHRLMDGIGDEARGDNKIGTTKRGIGPCYMDRDNRIGIRVCDLMDEEEFAKRLKENLEIKNKELKLLYDHEPLSYEEVLKEYLGYAERLRPYVCDTIALLNDEIKEGRKILFEGAQATMLDIDYGTYPYVTASHPISGGVGVGAGVAPNKIDKVVGIVKAYCTRVGEGPFPTEQLNAIGEKIREEGHEYGVVTGRPRRTGWLDACVVRYAGLISGIDYMAVTRLDILDNFEEIKMCVAYKYKGEILNEIPASLKVLAEVEPVYETFEGWNTSISKVRKYEDLPENAKKYLERMAEVTGIKLGIVSVGPNRDETIVLAKDIF